MAVFNLRIWLDFLVSFWSKVFFGVVYFDCFEHCSKFYISSPLFNLRCNLKIFIVLTTTICFAEVKNYNQRLSVNKITINIRAILWDFGPSIRIFATVIPNPKVKVNSKRGSNNPHLYFH